MVIKIIWKSSNEKESYGHMGGDSLINAVSVLPLKFGQNYWVIPLLTGAVVLVSEREGEVRKREYCGETWGDIECVGPSIWFWQCTGFITPAKQNLFFFFLFLAFSINSIHDIPIFAQHFTTLLSSHPLSFSSFGYIWSNNV